MRTRWSLVPALVVAITLAAPLPAEAQDEAALDLFAFGGFQNAPASFDAHRQVDYGGGLRVGAGAGIAFSDYVSLRGDYSYTSSSGQETGLVSEDVDFSRQYASLRLQLSYPMASGFKPYAFGGGGLVTLKRRADSYSFDFQEIAGVFGAGFRYDFSDSPFGIFAEGKGWAYNRNTLGESQLDKVLNLGVSFRAVSP